MNNAFTDSLPPIPEDLWPKLLPEPRETNLADDAWPLTLIQLGEILVRSVQREMETCGEYAARAELAPTKERSLQLTIHAHMRADAAARLLLTYEEAYPQAMAAGAQSLPTPAQLKIEATSSYRIARREEELNQVLLQAVKGDLPPDYQIEPQVPVNEVP